MRRCFSRPTRRGSSPAPRSWSTAAWWRGAIEIEPGGNDDVHVLCGRGGRDPRRRGGAAASRGLQGKRTPKAYIVTEVEITGDREVYQRDYAQYAQSTVEPFGGHYLARGGRVLGTEGEPPKARIVISEFPSFEAARDWRYSPAYEKIVTVRLRESNSRQYIVEGPSE